MTFAQRGNRLTTNFSERIPVVKRRMTVYTAIHTDYCTASSGRQTTASKIRHSWRTSCKVLGRRQSHPNRSTVPAFAEDGEEQLEKLAKTADVRSIHKAGNSRRCVDGALPIHHTCSVHGGTDPRILDNDTIRRWEKDQLAHRWTKPTKSPNRDYNSVGPLRQWLCIALVNVSLNMQLHTGVLISP